MDDKHREILRRYEWYLGRDLEPTRILPLLHRVLSASDVQEIKALDTREKQSAALLDMLPRRGPKAFEVFVQALQGRQQFLAGPLIDASEKEGIKIELSIERTRSARLSEELRGLRTRLENETKTHEKTVRELGELKSLHQLLLEQTKTEKQDVLLRVQELEYTRKHVEDLEDALRAERSEKERFVEKTTRLRELCDQMREDARQKENHLHSLEERLGNIAKENNELMEKLRKSTDFNHNEMTGYYSMNEENSKETRIENQMYERIPKTILHSIDSSDEKATQGLISDTDNADSMLETSRNQCELIRVSNENDALKRKCEELEEALARLERQQRTVTFHDRATSPGVPIRDNFEDQRCSRCDALEEERNVLRKEKDCIKERTEKFEKEIKQLKSKMKELEDDYYTDRQTLQKEIENTKHYFQLLSQHLEEMNSRQSGLNEEQLQEMRTLQEENGGLKTQVQKLKSEIHKMTVELVNEKSKVERNQQEYDKGKKNLKREKKKAQELKEKLELEERAKEELAKQVGILKRDLKLVEKQKCDETERLGEGLKIEREKCEVLKEEIQRWRNLPGRVFNYTKDFDRHGVFYALGTNFGTTPWVNPARASSLPTRVIVTRSSDDQGDAADLLENRITFKKSTLTCTKDEERSWWCVDLSEKYALFLTHYTLRHGRDNGMAVIRNWRLEGSLDGRTWRLLKKHENDRGLKDPYPYYTATWPIDGDVGAFRYFRIFQTGKNSSGRFAVYLSGIELYGVLLEMDH